MPKRQLKRPLHQIQGEQTINWDQNRFGGGMYLDVPASDIADDALALDINCHNYPNYVEGRTGSKLYSNTALPTLREKMTMSKSGNIVTSTAGTQFDGTEVGQYIVWPDGENDQITQFLSATQVQVRDKGTKALVFGVALRGVPWGIFFHKALNKVLLHIDTRLFFADNLISGWTEIPTESVNSVLRSPSKMAQDDNNILVFNEACVFRVRLDLDDPFYYQTNSPVPTTLISGFFDTTATVVALVDRSDAQDDRKVGRRYIMGMLKLNGMVLNGDRTTTDVIIQQESGANKIDADGIDFGEIFEELKIGTGEETLGRIIGGDLAAAKDTPSEWESVTDAQFMLEMDFSGTGAITTASQNVNIVVDFTGVVTMKDVADRIQDAIQAFFPSVRFTFGVNTATDAGRFTLDTGEVDGAAVASLTNGAGGTNIASDLKMKFLEEDDISNIVKFTQGRPVGNLVPAVSPGDASTTIEKHWNMFSIWGTSDTGVDGLDPVIGEGNNPQLFTWLGDVPMGKAYTANFTNVTAVAQATDGVFHAADVGNELEYEDGSKVIITRLDDGTGNQEVFTKTSLFVSCAAVSGGALPGNLAAQSAVIGGGNVVTASQVGRKITIVSGYSFVADDKGRPFFYADGSIVHIASVDSATEATTIEFVSKPSQGATINPVSRVFNDTISDFFQKARITSLTIQQRLKVALPVAQLGVIVPGFVVVAEKNDTKIYYSAMPTTEKYLVGYYEPSKQLDDKPEDAIQDLRRFPDRLIVLCRRSTYGTPTNVPTSFLLPSIGLAVALLPRLSLVDNIGTNHVGSIYEIDIGQEIMVTHEPAVRVFDGYRFTQLNLAELQVMELLRQISVITVANYDHVGGYTIWGALKE